MKSFSSFAKKKHNIVDRHIDKFTVTIPKADEEKINRLIDTFKWEQMPEIQKYALNKVHRKNDKLIHIARIFKQC